MISISYSTSKGELVPEGKHAEIYPKGYSLNPDQKGAKQKVKNSLEFMQKFLTGEVRCAISEKASFLPSKYLLC